MGRPGYTEFMILPRRPIRARVPRQLHVAIREEIGPALPSTQRFVHSASRNARKTRALPSRTRRTLTCHLARVQSRPERQTFRCEPRNASRAGHSRDAVALEHVGANPSRLRVQTSRPVQAATSVVCLHASSCRLSDNQRVVFPCSSIDPLPRWRGLSDGRMPCFRGRKLQSLLQARDLARRSPRSWRDRWRSRLPASATRIPRVPTGTFLRRADRPIAVPQE